MTITKRDELAYRASRFSRSWLVPLLLGLALAAAGWVSTPGSSAAAPSLYAAFIALLIGNVAIASVRELFTDPRLRRTTAPPRWAQSTRGRLREYAATVAGASGSAAAIETLPAALEEVLGIRGAALHLRGAGEIAAPAEEGGDSGVAEAATEYGNLDGVRPVLAGGRELGRLRLGNADGVDDDSEALAFLLACPAALLVENRRLQMLADDQRREIELLRHRLESETNAVVEEVRSLEGFSEIIGDSSALAAVLALAKRMAPSEVAILITGETGTGKELLTRAIHGLSPRRDGPLITVNCPAIPGPLAESELFGHERGAFTDAVMARPGQFEIADGGTVLLDEIADLPLDIQAKLLRVLQEAEVRRVGGRRPRPVNVRVLAATNRDLRLLVRQGRFREDLYYRLAAAEICMPPLRDRHGDIPLLASFFLQRAAAAHQRAAAGFSPEALARLSAYRWPGNVRQLQNVVQRAVLLCPDEVIRPAGLTGINEPDEPTPATFGDAMRQEKRRRFLEALEQTAWNQSAAARLLGMSRSNFARMLRSLQIRRDRHDERGHQ